VSENDNCQSLRRHYKSCGKESVAAILWGSWGPDPLFGSGDPNVHGPPRISVMLLYTACNP